MFWRISPISLFFSQPQRQSTRKGATRKLIPFENGQLELWTAKSQTAQRIGRAEIYILRFYGNADRADRWVAAEAEAWNDVLSKSGE